MSDKGDKKTFKLEQVAEHSKPDDCWLVIDGLVYDVTKFLDNHPGGPEIVTDHAGTDATEEFDTIGHSEDARRQLKDYLLGELEGGSTQSSGASVTASSAQSGGNTLYIVLALLVLGVGIYLNFAFGESE
eukprot:CAMPEP_0196782072 /NCGR_PEP_ID=MMETSP1104-20130614/10637_1 /TAXON_ID=33652 /ORGANISM="Cafeteria sp., Strain Caron Lab Isolate" /LENGTH=129 /DNA_ID=CAMNT_0042152303 /DNA_START=8 /DNA_END=397 /DNA_ORIENTATION=+